MATTGRPRTRGNRQQIGGEIDKRLVAELNDAWRRSGRRRWEVIQDVVAYGLAEYKRRERDAPGTLDLLDRAG